MSRRVLAVFSGALALVPLAGFAQTAPPTQKKAEPQGQIEISPEARKLLPALEPFAKEMTVCQAALAELEVMSAKLVELKNAKKGRKEQEKAEAEFYGKRESAFACVDAVQKKAIPAMEAISSAQEAWQEAWSIWVDKVRSPAKESPPPEP